MAECKRKKYKTTKTVEMDLPNYFSEKANAGHRHNNSILMHYQYLWDATKIQKSCRLVLTVIVILTLTLYLAFTNPKCYFAVEVPVSVESSSIKH